MHTQYAGTACTHSMLVQHADKRTVTFQCTTVRKNDDGRNSVDNIKSVVFLLAAVLGHYRQECVTAVSNRQQVQHEQRQAAMTETAARQAMCV